MKRNGIPFRHAMTIVAVVFTAMSAPWPFFGGAPDKQEKSDLATNASHPRFADVSAKLGLNYVNQGSHTSRKYLIETRGPGVALFDFDNDGRLGIFVVNGPPLKDPTPKGAIPEKTGPKYWNRPHRQKADGTFEDVRERAGLRWSGHAMGVAVGDYDNDGYEDLYVTAYEKPRELLFSAIYITYIYY